jgi:hypothetical protein
LVSITLDANLAPDSKNGLPFLPQCARIGDTMIVGQVSGLSHVTDLHGGGILTIKVGYTFTNTN